MQLDGICEAIGSSSLRSPKRCTAMRAVLRAPLCGFLRSFRLSCHWRATSTAAGGGSNHAIDASALEGPFAALTASVNAAVDAGAADLSASFGGSGAEKRWMLSYYRHRKANLLLPALRALLADGRVSALPSLASKTVLFAGAVLRSAPAETSRAAVAGLPFVIRDQALLAGVLRCAGTPAAAELLQRLAAGARRAGDSALVAAVQHVGSVPQAPPEAWAPPFAAPTLAADWQRLAQPCELAPVWRQVRDTVTFQQYLLLASTTHLECLWSSFYATGASAPLAAVVDLASRWAEFAPQLDDQVEFLVDIARPLPADWTADVADEAGQRRAARAAVSRAACWSLLHNARRHERVTVALCDAIAKLAPQLIEREPGDGIPEAPVEAQHSETAGEGAAASDAPQPPLTVSEAHARLEVIAPLLHLFSRLVVDSHKAAGPSGGSGSKSESSL